MTNLCAQCQRRYDDAIRSTICPHEQFLTEEQAAQKDRAFTLLGKRVRFAHLGDDTAARLTSIGYDGMLTLDGFAGEFAPHLFVEVSDAK